MAFSVHYICNKNKIRQRAAAWKSCAHLIKGWYKNELDSFGQAFIPIIKGGAIIQFRVDQKLLTGVITQFDWTKATGKVTARALTCEAGEDGMPRLYANIHDFVVIIPETVSTVTKTTTVVNYGSLSLTLKQTTWQSQQIALL